jgi:hypothetical protein
MSQQCRLEFMPLAAFVDDKEAKRIRGRDMHFGGRESEILRHDADGLFPRFVSGHGSDQEQNHHHR